MKPETLIANRFTPGNPVPIFFAGRQNELSQLYLTLVDFQTYFPLTSYGKTQIVTGKAGIGKSALLLKFRQQVQSAPEFETFVAVYVSLHETTDAPGSLAVLLLQELENAISARQRELILQTIVKPKWQQLILQIDPELTQFLDKAGWNIKKNPGVPQFFALLRQYYQNPEQFSYLILLLNLLLQDTGLFIILILDHFEALQDNPEIMHMLTPYFLELDKRHLRFWTVVGIEETAFNSLSRMQEGDPHQEFSLFTAHNVVTVHHADDCVRQAQRVYHLLLSGERVPVVAVPAQSYGEKVFTQLQTCFSRSLYTITLDTPKTADLNSVLIEAAGLLVQGINQTVADFVQKGLSQKSQLVLKMPSFSQADSLPKVIDEFCQVLGSLNQFLQSNYPDLSVAVIWKNFQNLRALGGNYGTGRPISQSFRQADTSYNITRTVISSAATSFISVFVRWGTCLSRLSLVPIWEVPVAELPCDSLDVSLAIWWEKCPVLRINALGQEDSIALLQEIAFRSSLILRDEIATDIYLKMGGHPFALHHVGYYLLWALDQNLNTADSTFLKSRLLKKYDPQEDGKSNRLVQGPDSKARLTLFPEEYHSVAPASGHELYRKIICEICPPQASEAFQMVLPNHGATTVSALLKTMQNKYPQLKAEELQSLLDALKQLKLILVENGKINIIHPYIKNMLQEILENDQHKKAGSSSKSHEPITTTRSQDETVITPDNHFTPTAKVKLQKTGSSSTRRLERVNLANIGTQSSKDKASGLLSDSAIEVERGELPSLAILQKISALMDLSPASPLFKSSIRYISSLSSLILKRLDTAEDSAQSISKFKGVLENIKAKQGVYDLVLALQHSLLGDEPINAAWQNQNYWTLASLYWLRYRISDDQKEFERTVEAFALYLSEKMDDPRSRTFFAELKEAGQKFAIPEQPSVWKLLLDNCDYLLALEKMQDSYSLANEIASLSPNRVVVDFHKYLLRYLVNLISREKPLVVREAALRVTGYFGNVLESYPEALAVIEECLHNNDAPSLRQTAASTVAYLMPFLDTAGRQELVDVWQKQIMAETDAATRQHMAERLSGCCHTIPYEDITGFFYGSLNNHPDRQLQSFSWQVLARLNPYCSPEYQQEIPEVLARYYEKILTHERHENLEQLTERLALAAGSRSELLSGIVDKIWQGIQSSHEQPLWDNCVAAVPVVYPFLAPKHKQQFVATYTQWLQSSHQAKKMAAATHLILFYHYVQNVEEIIAKTIETDGCEMTTLLCHAWPYLSKLSAPLQKRITHKMLDGMECMLRLRDEAGYAQAITSAARSVVWFGNEENHRLTAHLQEALQGPSSLVILLLRQSRHIVPFVDKSVQSPLLATCYHLAQDKTLCPQDLATIWETMALLPPSAPMLELPFLYGLRDRINRYPASLLSPGFQLLAHLSEQLPQQLILQLEDDAVHYLSCWEYSQDAVSFIIRCGRHVERLADYLYPYQCHAATSHLVWGLYETYPDLGQVANVEKNYEVALQQDPYQISLQLAEFHCRSHSPKRAEQWLNWILENSWLPYLKIKAMLLQIHCQLDRNDGQEAKKSLEILHELLVG